MIPLPSDIRSRLEAALSAAKMIAVPRYHVFVDSSEGVTEREYVEVPYSAIVMLRDALGTDDEEREENLRAALAELDRLSAALAVAEAGIAAIGRRARCDGTRTFDDCMRDLGWIDDECRRHATITKEEAGER